MRRAKHVRHSAVLFGLILLCAGCGGGGGSGGGGGGSSSDGAALILSVETIVQVPNGQENVLTIWTREGTSAPGCVGPIPLNAPITFRFAGRVHEASVPGSGTAQGTINITSNDGLGSQPAFGRFSISDDPAYPAGNKRLVTFLPDLANDPSQPEQAGLQGNVIYSIFVPRGGSSAQVLTVAGTSLVNEVANVCFNTCDPGPNPQQCFVDPVPGVPYIVATAPVQGSDPPAPAVSPQFYVDPVLNTSRLSFQVSEPLYPGTISIGTIQLMDLTKGIQVAGEVRFFQAGTPEAGAIGSRIDFLPSSRLSPDTTFELQVSENVRDFGGQSLRLYPAEGPPSGSGRMLFRTLPESYCPLPDLREEFNGLANRRTASRLMEWIGNGKVSLGYPIEEAGDGSDGPLFYAAGNHIIDTDNEPAGGTPGVFNATSLTVAPGADVRVTGSRPLHIRCLGSAQIEGRIEASATALPGRGFINNGGGTFPNIVPGGAGGPGGGAGGAASQSGPVRTDVAASGFGPLVVPPVLTGQDPFFGGGQGGQSGFTAGATPGMGGLGGAGGSAFGRGEDGGPYGPIPFCAPISPAITQTRALAPTPPFGYVLPVSRLAGGSGGGGGGDRFALTSVANDNQGSGGGGGGGGLRISTTGVLTIPDGGRLLAQGARGREALFGSVAGAGGGGSGGIIWLQSFNDVIIGSGAFLQVNGGLGNTSCSNNASGRGGAGLLQIEDQDGMVNTMFIGNEGISNVGVTTFPFSPKVQGSVVSHWMDTGSGSPRFDAAPIIESALGNISGATVLVEFQGAYEAVSSTPTSVQAAEETGTPREPTPWVSATEMSALDGRRFVRFRVSLAYDVPPASHPGSVFPEVTSIIITVQGPGTCSQ